MAFSYTCLTLQRCVIPILLVLTALLRPVGISFVYLLMYFISPFVPVATSANFKGSVTAYYSILITLSTIILLCHAGLQVSLAVIGTSADIFNKCSFSEQIVRHIGFVNFQGLGTWAVIEWLAPEIIIFVASMVAYWVMKKLSSKPNEAQLERALNDDSVPFDNTITRQIDDDNNEPNFIALIKISPLICLVALFFAAILRPSAPGGLYFLIFLLSASYMATYQKLQRGFVILLRLVMIVMIIHIFCIVAYQTPYIQEHLDKKSLTARLIGLEPLITSNCTQDIRLLTYNTDYKLDSFLSPIAILLAYYVFALTSKNLLHPLLVRQNKQANREAGGGNNTSAEAEGDIVMTPVNSTAETEQNHKNTLCDQICYGFISVGGFIYENSYIFTNILMMAWSIVYHSWLTFVLLLWGNVLWMLENQRYAMMKSTPFIVIYAELLLLAQYIYGMDLTNDELPTKVDITGINLEQIGFIRPQENDLQPCVPLIVKTSFLLMFWVTLRQFFKEKLTQHRTKYTTNLFSPLRSNGDETDTRDNKRTSKILKKIGSVIKNLLVRLWIWLVILVILLCALTGSHMTGFRICYMALFLLFLLVFQSSSQVWVKVMYGFWIFLIFYAMSILILIYTYQFDKFDQYWNDYLNISTTLQYDIGLERYQTKDLFLHLLSPTIIVILTAIQVHYFHKRFIASLIKTTTAALPTEAASSEPSRHHSMHAVPTSHAEIQLSNVTDLVRVGFKKLVHKVKLFLKSSKRFIWRLLEFHFIKVVYIFAFVCCINQICVLHLPFLFLCVIGSFLKTRAKIVVSFAIAFITTIIILTRMIYQVAYLDHSKYDVQCPNTNLTENNAAWFGLKKADEKDGGLIGLLRFYIIYMVITTIHAVIRLRQSQAREKYNLAGTAADEVMFPEVVRADAEKNIQGLMKYLCNYGYYKFGMEVCMIWLVATITYRQDVMASLYAGWLVVLIYLFRSKAARIWNIFQLFIAIAILVQYIVLLNFPPSFCIKYAWQDTIYSDSVQGWAMLPGQLHYDHSKKLMFDFILLMLVNRQRKVFLIEKQQANNPGYAGGSNKSVVNDIKNLGLVPFENPTRDFLSSVRNYLDILKNIVLCGLFWITLATIFLAGTNIGDLLGLGYLIIAIILLWLGSDFYLKPITFILRYWNLMIYYNVANIVVKTIMQLVGCIFMPVLAKECCWFVHLLSISCSSKPESAFIDPVNGNEICPAVNNKVVLIWDAICFALLICQLRIFKSHYFCHIILDARANSLLASRGAVLIEELRQKQIVYRQQHENEVLLKIKRKMEKIRATQQKLLRPLDKPSHFDEFGYPIAGKTPKRKQIKYHPQAVRAGDYYMFDEVDEKFQLDVIDDTVDYLDTHEKITEADKKMTRRKTLMDQAKLLKPTRSDSKSEEILEEEKKDEEPSTSHDVSEKKTTKKDETDGDRNSDDEDIDENPIVRLLESFFVALTVRLNRYSRSYRYVNRVLSNEKKELRQQTHMMGRLGRTGAAAMFSSLRNSQEVNSAPEMPYSPNNNAHETIEYNKPSTLVNEKQSKPQKNENLEQVENSFDTIDQPRSRGDIAEPDNNALEIEPDVSELQLDEQDFASREHNIIIEVLIALYYVLLANTDVICYIVVFVYQISNASIISLPLPIMVFLWGTLSLPRPTKTFWVTLIAYTQAIVVIKCIFQFKLIWSNYISYANQPLTPEKVFGVEANPNYAIVDIILLIVLFFHRFMLKSQGLWKSEYRDVLIIGPEGTDNASEPGGEDKENNSQSVPRSSPQGSIHKDTDSISSYHERMKSFKRKEYKESLGQFFTNLVRKTRMPTDVYALMFMCDFINFLVLLFNFSAFASQQVEGESGGVQTYLAENKVPIPFLIMLLAQFLLIVIDRALYLRKALIPKIVFHFFSVVFIHIWMFFVVPAVTERSFYLLTAPIVFYIIKCFYLLLSSYQIKCGYPKRVLGNFLCKGFTLPNTLSFKIYTLIPFVYELRTILDWVCVDTTMTLFDWLKMEDIFTEIFFIKCSRQLENDFPSIRAQKKALSSKLLLGGGIVFLIVVAIWGPLCLFALSSAVGQANVPYEVGVSIRLGPYDPIYAAVNRESIDTFSNSQFQTLKDVYAKEKQAMNFLSGYDAIDIAAVKMAGNSPSMWNISPPDKLDLIDNLSKNVSVTARFTYTLTRVKPDKDATGISSGEVTTVLRPEFDGIPTLISMLKGEADATAKFVIPNFIPKFLKVLNMGDLSVVSALMPKESDYRPLAIKINKADNSPVIWWEIADHCEDDFASNYLKKIPLSNCEDGASGIVMYTFNDKKFPSTFSFITKGGIIGLYTTLVLLFSRILKSFITGKNRRIMFEDLPYVDRVLQLCLDIYLVREALEFTLEEDLFAKLLFLYRSPETMIKWTRPQEETAEEEAETESVRSRPPNER